MSEICVINLDSDEEEEQVKLENRTCQGIPQKLQVSSISTADTGNTQPSIPPCLGWKNAESISCMGTSQKRRVCPSQEVYDLFRQNEMAKLQKVFPGSSSREMDNLISSNWKDMLEADRSSYTQNNGKRLKEHDSHNSGSLNNPQWNMTSSGVDSRPVSSLSKTPTSLQETIQWKSSGRENTSIGKALPMLQCPYASCEQCFNSLSDLESHVLRHSDLEEDEVYMCGDCDMEFTSVDILLSHEPCATKQKQNGSKFEQPSKEVVPKPTESTVASTQKTAAPQKCRQPSKGAVPKRSPASSSQNVPSPQTRPGVPKNPITVQVISTQYKSFKSLCCPFCMCKFRSLPLAIKHIEMWCPQKPIGCNVVSVRCTEATVDVQYYLLEKGKTYEQEKSQVKNQLKY